MTKSPEASIDAGRIDDAEGLIAREAAKSGSTII